MAVSAAAARRSAALRERVILRHRNEYRKRADRYFAGFYRRVAPTCARVAGEVKLTKADLSIYGEVYAKLGRYSWDQETRILSTTTSPVILGTMEDAWRFAADEVGVGISFDLNARPIRSVLSGVGTRIQQVTDTSRERTASMIADGIEKGLSIEQIVKGVPPGTTSVRGPIPEFPGIRGMVDSWTSTGLPGFAGGGTGRSSRSYLIALTETGNAYNLAACEAYAEGGVAFVEVFDGQDCGWSSHDDPDLAHGSVRALADARRQPLSHPRCQRAIAAREDVDAAQPSPYAESRARGGSVPGATPGIGAVDPLDAEALHLSGYEKVARPRPDVAVAAQRQWERARVAEPSISRALQQVTDGRMVTFEEAMAQAAAKSGGDLAGYAARRKSLTSLSRKIDSDMKAAATKGTRIGDGTARAAAGEIGDTVRYTVRFTEAEYAAGQRRIVEELLAAGHRPVPGKWKVNWSDDANRAYRGINSNWTAPNGTVFEVQFHTPRSFYVKEINHPKYEIARLPTTSVDDATRLYDEMHELVVTVDIPPGVMLTADDVARMADDFARSGTFARAGARSLDVFADDAVVAARARYDAARAFTRATGKGNDELMAASRALDDAVKAAVARAQERIRAMSAAEARAALGDIREAIAKIDETLKVPAGRGSLQLRRLQHVNAVGWTEISRLRQVREFLIARQTEVARRLPFSERVLPRAKRASKARDVYDEAIAIEKAISELYPELSSAWTGVVKLKSPGRNAAAAFDWEQALVVKPTTAAYGEAARLKVLIHEMFHSVSPDLSPKAYAFGNGWEEGVVEGMTQFVYARVRELMGRPPVSAPYQSYRRYVAAFRDVQEELGRSDADFWPALMRVASDERQDLLSKWVNDAILGPTATTRSRERLMEKWQKLLRTAKLSNKYG